MMLLYSQKDKPSLTENNAVEKNLSRGNAPLLTMTPGHYCLTYTVLNSSKQGAVAPISFSTASVLIEAEKPAPSGALG